MPVFVEGKSLLTQTRELLNRHGLKARKGLGQHFLVDGRVLHKIIAAAELSPADAVVEVGPGLGILTRRLALKAGRVTAVELDGSLAAILKAELSPLGNVSIVNDNILNIPPGSLAGGQPYKVVANLPYYITSPVLRHFLESPDRPAMMVVTVQKEVARVITARPGDMSLLSVSVQLYGRPKMVASIPARAFFPAPEVDSAVVRIDVYPRPLVPPEDDPSFFQLARAGFTASRKQIANSLAQGLGWPKTGVLEMLNEAGIDPMRRAETLTLDDWLRLFQAYRQRAR
ncbi:MAG: ribosomal RNA small subunit methyltransferase A [Chloroflexi bacterium]|nr:ribosomal RNA small subunit methyltransferase A [Chloroflexota bacterium]